MNNKRGKRSLGKTFVEAISVFGIELAGGKFSHDLAKILDEAERNYLCKFIARDKRETFQLRRASNYYASKVFEYPALGEALYAYPETPDTNVLINAADKLVNALREPCLEAAH